MRLDAIEWLRIGALVILLIVAWFALSENAKAETCVASFYDRGARTANGERFDPYGRTAASLRYPIGARLRVSLGGRSEIVRVNDRGPAPWTHHCIDMTRGGARRLGFEHNGVARVSIERVR